MSGLVSYLNGQLISHEQVTAELNESGGGPVGGFYDAERTFNGQVFKLRQHLQRLYGNLESARIDTGLSLEAMESATLDVLEANRSLLATGDDFTLSQVVTTRVDTETGVRSQPNILIFCELIDFAAFAWSYAAGVRLTTPITYTAPARPTPDGAKGTVQQSFSLMTDPYGYVTELRNANFMFVKGGRIKLPDRKKVLPGISMETALELAASLGVPVDEGHYSAHDVYQCDEVLIGGTKFCILPVATLNGLALGDEMPGPVTRRLFEAWNELVGLDFVQQAMRRLPIENSEAPSKE